MRSIDRAVKMCDARDWSDFDQLTDKFISSVKEKASGSDPVKAYYAIKQVMGKFSSQIIDVRDEIKHEADKKESESRKRFFEVYNRLEKELGNKIRK